MTDTEKPTYEELAALAYLGIHTARDLTLGHDDNAKEGANVIRALSYAVFERLGGNGQLTAWGQGLGLQETFESAIAFLGGDHPKTGMRAYYVEVLTQAIEAVRMADAEEAATAVGRA